jgi:hypothetical protein
VGPSDCRIGEYYRNGKCWKAKDQTVGPSDCRIGEYYRNGKCWKAKDQTSRNPPPPSISFGRGYATLQDIKRKKEEARKKKEEEDRKQQEEKDNLIF